MNITLPYTDFRQLIQTACKVLESSDLGREAISGEGTLAFWLRADERTLTLDTAVRGLEMSVQVDLATCDEPGELAINPYMLRRMAVKAQDVTLIGQPDQLAIKAGRFRTSVATIQNVKQQHYDEVPLTHRIPSKVLSLGLAATSLDQSKQPFSRFVWDSRGARLWTHNAYNAAYTVVLDEPATVDLDCTIPVGLLQVVADTAPKQDLRIGIERAAIRLQNDLIDVTHPIQNESEIEDIETALKGLDADSIPHFEIDPAKFSEALQAVGSVDRSSAGTPQAGVLLRVLPDKKRVVVSVRNSVGESTHRVDLGPCTLEEPALIRLNLDQLGVFVGRSKGQKLRIGSLPDRTIMWSGTNTYVLAPVQEDQDV